MDELIARIQSNLAAVEQKITAAAQISGRMRQDIRLVVVTKSQSAETVEAVLRAGAYILGENYPEETLAKIEVLKNKYPVEWHMIGHLQSRKAKIVAEHFHFFQSLDRIEIAQKLNQQLSVTNRRLPVLLEFNTAGEASKSGWDASREQDWETLLPDIRILRDLPHLEIRGLMTMPPLLEDPEQVRPYFSRLSRLRDFITGEIPDLNLRELSMGTSADYEIGVQEGATLVRVGTAILGPRIYHTEIQHSS
jgi:PLP dependent protein